MIEIRRILIGGLTVLAVGLLSASVGNADEAAEKASKRIGPTVKIHKGERCVEDTEFMRRDHMKLILHQRDETMHRGIRTKKHSLTNCIDCHADPQTNSVLGQDGFCESCHVFASVSMDCFSCHTPSPEKKPSRKASKSNDDLLNAMQSSAIHPASTGVRP